MFPLFVFLTIIFFEHPQRQETEYSNIKQKETWKKLELWTWESEKQRKTKSIRKKKTVEATEEKKQSKMLNCHRLV